MRAVAREGLRAGRRRASAPAAACSPPRSPGACRCCRSRRKAVSRTRACARTSSSACSPTAGCASCSALRPAGRRPRALPHPTQAAAARACAARVCAPRTAGRGRRVASGSHDAASRVRGGFMAALAALATRGRHANVLQHMPGYFRAADRRRRRGASSPTSIADYRPGLVPLVVPVTLIAHHARRIRCGTCSIRSTCSHIRRS